MAKSIPCPICKKTVEVGAEDFPFCSERCRTIDLGKWASGEYRIASPVFDEELIDELEKAQQAKTADDEWKN